MPNVVTDPRLIQQLNERAAAQSGAVTDPRLIQELNDRAAAQAAGVNYDQVAASTDGQYNRKQTGSVFGNSGAAQGADRGGSFFRGMVGRPLEGIAQAVTHAGNAAQKYVGMDPNKGMLGGQGMFSDNNVAYADAAPKISEQQYEQSRKDSGRSGVDMARIAGSLMMPVPGGGIAGKVGGMAGHALQGAAQGAAAGAMNPVDNSSGGDFARKKMAETLLGGAVGGGVGGTLGAAAAKLGKGGPSQTERALNAADSLGIPVGYGQVTNNVPLGRTAQLSANMVGGSDLTNAAQRTVTNFGDKAAATAATVGDGLTRNDSGAATRSGIDGFAKSFSSNANKLYGRVDQTVEPATRAVDMTNTVLAMVGPMNAFQSSPKLGEDLANSKLLSFARSIAGKAPDGSPISSTPNRLTFAEAQRLRSEIGGMMDAPALGPKDIPQKELAQVYNGITQDMRGSLADSPQGLRDFDRATNYWRAGRARIDNVLSKVLGNGSSDEQIADRVGGMLQNDAQGLVSLKRSMHPDEWNTVASSMLSQMGHTTPANAGETGASFSIDKFLTDYNKLRRNKEAFSFAFGGTPYEKAAGTYDQLATLASSLKNNNRLANHSGSGYHATLAALVFKAMTNPAEAATLLGANKGFAYSMANPRFARWIVDAGKIASAATSTTAEVASKAQIAKLAAIGATNEGE